MTLTFAHGHRVTRKVRTCAVTQLLTCAIILWHEVAQTFAVVDYVRIMTAEKPCKEGESESFEHLLFVFVIMFVAVFLSESVSA